MKIISKFKDYYDYLQGIYGVDELLVLDRTEYTPISYPPSDYTKVSLYICDWLIEGMYIDGQFHYGIALDKYQKAERYADKNKYRIGNQTIFKTPKKLTDRKINSLLDCPILIEDHFFSSSPYRIEGITLQKNPILKEYNIQKLYPAKEMWLMLSEWLAKNKDNKIKQTPLTNKEKIVSKGFDLKTSFRHPTK